MRLAGKLFFIFIVLTGCTRVSFEDNKRLEIRGTVQDTDGNPVENLEVFSQTIIHNWGLFSSQDPGNINSGVTNATGDFSFISLDVTPGRFMLKFEPVEGFQSLTFEDNRQERPETLIDLGEITFRKRKDVNLEFLPAAGFEGRIRYKVRTWNPDPVITIYNWENLQENTDHENYQKYLEYEGSLEANEEGRYLLRLGTLADTEMEVIYDFENILDEDSPEIEIPVVEDTNIYEISE